MEDSNEQRLKAGGWQTEPIVGHFTACHFFAKLSNYSVVWSIAKGWAIHIISFSWCISHFVQIVQSNGKILHLPDTPPG
jgi:hypothetical protein